MTYNTAHNNMVLDEYNNIVGTGNRVITESDVLSSNH